MQLAFFYVGVVLVAEICKTIWGGTALHFLSTTHNGNSIIVPRVGESNIGERNL